MFAKFAAMITFFALCAASLLSMRQERLQALSEMTQAQLRINRQDDRLWMLRTKIAERITPPQIEQMTAGLVDLQPIAPYKALTKEQLAALTDGAPVGPPAPLNPQFAVGGTRWPVEIDPSLVAPGSKDIASKDPAKAKAGSSKSGSKTAPVRSSESPRKKQGPTRVATANTPDQER